MNDKRIILQGDPGAFKDAPVCATDRWFVHGSWRSYRLVELDWGEDRAVLRPMPWHRSLFDRIGFCFSFVRSLLSTWYLAREHYLESQQEDRDDE